jgi:Ca-activated chloride channel homolog
LFVLARDSPFAVRIRVPGEPDTARGGRGRVVLEMDNSGPGRGAAARPLRRRGGLEGNARATGSLGFCHRGALGSCLVLALLGSPPATAQALATQSASQQKTVPRFPVDVRAVALDVVVTDRQGHLVSGLKREDFRVLEEGVPQELTFFIASRTPLTVIVLLDSSASVRSDLRSVQKAANRFIDKLGRGDRARIGYFHERVVFGPRFTDDMKEHSAIVNQMRPQRSTHLYDALVEALRELQPVPKRKALVVFSDGEDQGSRASMSDALEAARQSDVSAYSVGLLGWSADDGMYTNQKLLEQIARLTGGRAFFPRNAKEMEQAFDRIRTELHSQYRMGYVATEDEEEPGRWREIQVELTRRQDLVVRSRLGYYYRDPQEVP